MTHFQLKNRFPPLEIKQAYQLSLLQELTVCQNSFQKKLSNKTNTDIDQKITQPSTNVYIDSSLLNSCLESLHTRLTRFIECQSFFTQCDIFNDILNDMSQVANTLATNPMYPTISFLTFCDCLIRLLVDLSSYQITLPRYRHYLTKKLLRFEKEDSFIQLGCNTTLMLTLKGQIEKVYQDISSFLSSKSVNETFIEPIIRHLIVFLEDDHLYYRFFNNQTCANNTQSNILTKTLQFFVHVLKGQVIAQRCSMQFTCKPQQGTQLNESIFLSLLKAITRFLPLVFSISESYDKAGCTPINIQSALINCFQTEVLTHFLNLLECYPISREVITIVGQQVAFLITKPNHTFCVTCLAQLLSNKFERTLTWKSSHMWYIMKRWKKLSLLSKISILRGVISLTSCKHEESLLELQPLLSFFKNHIQPENHLITFYAFQGVYVWVTCVAVSVSPDLQNIIQNDILCLLYLCMDYWNSGFKPLASLCFRIWEACVNVYQHVKELVDMLRKKLLEGDLSKFSLLALSSLISQKTSRYYVQQDSLLFLYTLYYICFKKCRNAAIQIILSILQNEQNEAKHFSFNSNSSNCLPYLNILGRILCETNPFNNFTQFSHIPTHLLTSSMLLKEILIKSLLPILQKKNTSLFLHLLDFLPFQQSFDKNRPSWYPKTLPSFFYWESTNAAVLSFLKELGYGTWESPQSNASLVFSFTPQTDKVQTISLTIEDLAYGLLLRNGLLKYYVLNILCQRREITKFPSLQEWLLVTRFCTISLAGTTLEFSSKNLDTVKKFLYGAFESLKQSHKNIPTSYVSRFKFFFITLLTSLGSFISCETTTLQLSLLCYFYHCVHALPNVIKDSIFSFAHTQSVYYQLIPYIFSSWDKERYHALQCLETFPSDIFYSCFNRFMTPVITLLYSLKHHEQSGAADFIIQSLCQILSNEIKHLTLSTFPTLQKNEILHKSSISTQLVSNSLQTNQLNPNLRDKTFLYFTKQFSTPFETTLIHQWIQQSLNSQNVIFTLSFFDRLQWYVSLIREECTNNKPWNTSGYFLLLTLSIQQLPLPCNAFIDSFISDQSTSLREWITTICLKIVNVFFSCVSCLFTTCFHSQHDVEQNGIEMHHVLTNVAWDETIDCRGHLVNLTENNQVLPSSQRNSTPSSRSWVVIKNAAKTLDALFQWIHLDSLLQGTLEKTKLTSEFFTHSAVKLIALALGLKHPAVIDFLSQAISSLTSCTARSQNLLYRNLTKQLLSIVTALFIPTQTPNENILLPLPPPLRRSSCLGKCIIALLLCDTSRDHTMNLFEFVMEPILNFLESFHTNFSDLDIAAYFVYNLNVCRSLIQGSLFVTSSSSYLGRLLSVSLHYSIHPIWSVRNAATLLFATTTEKITGIRWDVTDTFESYNQPTMNELCDEGCRHGIGFFFCTESQRRSLQRKKGRYIEDIFALYPALKPLFSKLLDAKGLQHPSLWNEGVVINIFLFLSRVQFVEKQCPLLQFIEYWRTNATNAFTRVLAACILSPFVDSGFYQLLKSYNTNNSLHGLLFTLLDHTGTMELTSKNVEHLLLVFQDTYHHTLRPGNRSVAPINVTLYLQCVETLYQRLQSIPIFHKHFKSLQKFICPIAQTYLSYITKPLSASHDSSLSYPYKNYVTLIDPIKESSPHSTQPITLNALQAYFLGQSLPLFITALRLFCDSATLQNLCSFLTTFHFPHVSQHINLFILNSTGYCFLEELFRVVSLRFTKETQLLNSTDFKTFVHILTFYFLHSLVKCEYSYCCIAFLTNTAREKLSSMAFTTLLCIVKYQRTTIHQHYDQPLLEKKISDMSCEDHTTTVQQESFVLSHLAYVVTEALKHPICHEVIFGGPLSQCFIHLKSFPYDSNTLLETVGSIFTICSLPSSTLAHRLIASKILTNVRLPMEALHESFSTIQTNFQFQIWTFTCFLLTDDHEDITKEACTVVKEMLCHFTTFTYLNKKCPLLAEKVCQLTHRSDDIITTVSLQYLLRILFLMFDHKKIIDTLTKNIQEDNISFFPSQENLNSSCFDKEPSRSNVIHFLYYVYSSHAENHTIFNFPFENCSLLHLHDHPSLEMEQGIQWVHQLRCPFQMYLNPNDTTQLFRLILHSAALGKHWESKKKQFIDTLRVAQSHGIILPLCLKLLIDQPCNHSFFTCISVFPQADFSIHKNNTE